MNFQQYHEFTPTTAVYPKDQPYQALFYLYSKLFTEIFELSTETQWLGKLEGHENVVVKECGDVLWYLSQLLHHFDITLSEQQILQINSFAKLEGFLKDEHFKNQKQFAHTLMYQYFDLTQYLTKGVRGDYDLDNDLIQLRLYSMLITTLKIANTDSASVFRTNYDKLMDRKERGVIRGSGDDR